MYRLTDEQQHVVSLAKTAVDTVIGPAAARVDQDGAFPRESLAALGAQGLLGLNVPTTYGGLGQGLRTTAAVLDVIAQRCGSTAMVYMMHLSAVGCYVAAADRVGPLLRDVAAGRHLATLAFSERGSRSNFWAPVSRAVRDDDGHVRITADKSFVTSAGHADGYVVSTLSATAASPVASTIYAVKADDPGLTVQGTWRGLGLRGNASAPMSLSDVRLGSDRALSADGHGLDLVLGVVLPAFQVGSAAVAIGMAEAAVAATIAHVTTARLEHTNSRLSDLPNLRSQIARMRIETDRARAHLNLVLDALETPGPATQLLVLEAKAAATETAVLVTDLAMRTCGGAAFGGAHGIERFFRDARAPIVMAPTTDHAHEFIGRALCGMEVF